MWFRPNRKKLIQRLVEDIVEDHYNWSKKRDWVMYLSDDVIKVTDNEVRLGAADKINKKIILYLNPITDMIINRIHRIITHEFNHLRGYAEEGAQKYEKKEKKFKELK